MGTNQEEIADSHDTADQGNNCLEQFISAQYEQEFIFISKFDEREQLVIQKVRYEQQLH